MALAHAVQDVLRGLIDACDIVSVHCETLYSEALGFPNNVGNGLALGKSCHSGNGVVFDNE